MLEASKVVMHYDHLPVTKFHVRPCGPILWSKESLPMSSVLIEVVAKFFSLYKYGVGIFKACKKLRSSPSLQNTHKLDEFLPVNDLIYMRAQIKSEQIYFYRRIGGTSCTFLIKKPIQKILMQRCSRNSTVFGSKPYYSCLAVLLPN